MYQETKMKPEFWENFVQVIALENPEILAVYGVLTFAEQRLHPFQFFAVSKKQKGLRKWNGEKSEKS